MTADPGQRSLPAQALPLWRSGPDGRFVDFNPAWLAFTGRTLEQELGLGWLEGLPPPERDGFSAKLLSASARGEAFVQLLSLRAADGSVKRVLLAGVPAKDAEGEWIGYSGALVGLGAAGVGGDAEQARTEVFAQELGALEAFRQGDAAGTPKRFTVTPLNEKAPEVFEDLTKRYAETLDLALAKQSFRDVEASPQDSLRRIADRLAVWNAGPRDVVELHSRALRRRVEGAHPRKAQSYVAEGRLMALELMGNLVALYRPAPGQAGKTGAVHGG